MWRANRVHCFVSLPIWPLVQTGGDGRLAWQRPVRGPQRCWMRLGQPVERRKAVLHRCGQCLSPPTPHALRYSRAIGSDPN